VRWWTSAAILFLATATRAAGPVDFGNAELNAALADRKLKLHVDTELNLDPPETFSIALYKTGMIRVTGGDLRGLMYGLIEASEQIRANGKLKATSGKPATAVRGVRMTLRSYELTQPWFTSDAQWRTYFQTLARDSGRLSIDPRRRDRGRRRVREAISRGRVPSSARIGTPRHVGFAERCRPAGPGACC
jgi:hypothetical protein